MEWEFDSFQSRNEYEKISVSNFVSYVILSEAKDPGSVIKMDSSVVSLPLNDKKYKIVKNNFDKTLAIKKYIHILLS